MEKMNNLCQKSEQWFIFREEAGTAYKERTEREILCSGNILSLYIGICYTVFYT